MQKQKCQVLYFTFLVYPDRGTTLLSLSKIQANLIYLQNLLDKTQTYIFFSFIFFRLFAANFGILKLIAEG